MHMDEFFRKFGKTSDVRKAFFPELSTDYQINNEIGHQLYQCEIGILG